MHAGDTQLPGEPAHRAGRAGPPPGAASVTPGFSARAAATEPETGHKPVSPAVVWQIFGTGFVLTSLLLLWSFAPGIAQGMSSVSGFRATCVAQALAFALGGAWALRGHLAPATTVMLTMSVVDVFLSSRFSNPGVAVFLMAFLGYLCCVAAKVAGRRVAWGLAGLSVLVIADNGWGAGGIEVSIALPQLLLLAMGMTIGLSAVKASEYNLAALMGREARYRKLFSASPSPMLLCRDGRIQEANQSMAELLGHAHPGEMAGRALTDYLPPGGAVDPAWRSLHECELLRVDGHRRTVETTRVEFDAAGKGEHLLICQDITERKAAAQAVERSERLLSHVINASPDIITLTDLTTGRYLLVNDSFSRLLDYPRNEVIGRNSLELGLWKNPSDRQLVVDQILAHGRAPDQPITFVRRNGELSLQRLSAATFSDGGSRYLVINARDITDSERQRSEAALALAAARDAAEAASRAKSRFLANMSHEIRTPLAGLVGLARLAQLPETPPHERERYLALLQESAQGLTTVISDVLDLSKIEAGKMELNPTPFDLRKLVESIVGAYSALAQGHGLSLSLDPLPPMGDLPRLVMGDPVRLRQILGNYLSNALKFTEQGGVRLVLQVPAPGRVRFEVIDTGAGLGPELHQRLFEPFSQADDSSTRRHGGTGLGLSICREMAMLLGGQVGVRSTMGEGSCFWVDLPLPGLDEPERDADTIPPAPGGGRSVANDSDHFRGKRMLVVEDNQVNGMIAEAMLSRWGIEVVLAVDGLQAIQQLSAEHAAGRRIDAVLMDLHMPVMSGYEATSRLRQEFDARQLPIIALTAAALVSERESALACGMNDFLTKPLTPEALHKSLVKQLGLARHKA